MNNKYTLLVVRKVIIKDKKYFCKTSESFKIEGILEQKDDESVDCEMNKKENS